MPRQCYWECKEYDGKLIFEVSQYGRRVIMSEQDARKFVDFVMSIKPRVEPVPDSPDASTPDKTETP